jgi:hypothetical protein
MLDMSVYTDRQKISQSAKNALQEWCADKKRRLPPPRYETLSEDGPDHKKTYVRACYIGDKLMGRGIGKNFKLADSAAAEDALKALMAQEEPAEKNAKKAEATKPKELPAPKKDSEPKIPVVKISDVVKNGGVKSVGASVALKNYATSNKKPSPTFRDLGERKNGNKTECVVECSFVGEITLGTGASRLEAREAACQLMVDKIGIGKKKAKKANEAAKSAEQKKNAQNGKPAASEKPEHKNAQNSKKKPNGNRAKSKRSPQGKKKSAT